MRELSKIIEFGRCACTRAKQHGRKCETFDFIGFTHFCDMSGWGNFKFGRKTSPEEVQTEDDGDKYMVEAYPKPCQAGSMVEGARAKIDWVLPLLRK
ncbi:hypothetical protein DRO03_01985 [Methanosarcinales archaeon]|nr:MAG: hypothetical protein DRO03_01985 [Methanosarcinales archaeon]